MGRIEEESLALEGRREQTNGVEKKKKVQRKRGKKAKHTRLPSPATDMDTDADAEDYELVHEQVDAGDFQDIFTRFDLMNQQPDSEPEIEVVPVASSSSESDMDLDSSSEPETKLSNKQLKAQSKMRLYTLKSTSSRPDLVEWVDATASDPVFLVTLKGLRNVVPVPRHWSQKKKYLQNKRGVLKKPFELPAYIRATGIMEIRDTQNPNDQSQKSNARARTQPKLGRMDIDYQKLHDAFFKYQTKPLLSIQGDMYYEGKEFEAKFHSIRPGDLSNDLRSALNMPPNAPAPWLINMQRYGPPPSYPNLKIPGLNAPIPGGAQWGYHPGGWGKPPVDEANRPLYGDVFGVYIKPAAENKSSRDIEHWGQLEPESEEESDDEPEQTSDPEPQPTIEDDDVDGFLSTQTVSGLETPAGEIELRKERKPKPVEKMPEKEEKKELYSVLKLAEKKEGFMGSSYTYDLTADDEQDEDYKREKEAMQDGRESHRGEKRGIESVAGLGERLKKKEKKEYKF